ncbi:MAG: nuclear transport factor 2 family protein [Acidimicrobiaceae bacterium]|nr:nuclear transport factor 2 family protein [Acidimicrobiaceae bacterium]
MGEGYDSFEAACEVIEHLFRISRDVENLDPEHDRERWQALIAEATALFSPEVELVTRDGTLYGPERLFSDFNTQSKDFKVHYDQLKFVDAGDGRVVGPCRMVLKAREGDDYMTSWPAGVYRVKDGKIVFFEGYPDGNKAMRDLGLDPSMARER